MIFTTPEVLGGGPAEPTIDLIADSSATGGAASIQRVALAANMTGATPHFHRRSSEVFHVIAGSMWFLEGEEVRLVPTGGVVVIAPNTVHAFAAGPDGAEALIVLTPGVERFGYFTLLARFLRGEVSREELATGADGYDNPLVESAAWDAHLSSLRG